ncbi:MAG: hypothetical protein A4E42_00952 [Methanoregulaceae archaeon PtaU1.Bin222]|nr:MAG: hypothetical protein A4E42_00952 [Methanoregulaceae archaeon PtaU1.Bin222]
MNPMTPVKQMMIAVMSDEMSMRRVLVWFTSTPMLFAT